MGTFQHHAIVLTTDEEYITPVLETAQRIFGPRVSAPISSGWNGYVSIFIAPDGSKEGWTESNYGDQRRAEFKAWLRNESNYEGYHSWVEIGYGELGYEIVSSNQRDENDS